LGDKIKDNKVGGHVTRKGEKRNAYIVLVGKPEGKRILGRPGRIRKNTVEISLQRNSMRERETIWLRIGTNIGLL
jgi:hypothetical protein